MPLSIPFHRPRRRSSSSSTSPRRSRKQSRRRLCLPCVAVERADSPPRKRADSPLRRAGFEHVDAAFNASRCACSFHPTTPPSTPSVTPNTARPPTPSVTPVLPASAREESEGRRRLNELLRRGEGTRGRSVELHDFNTNMLVLVTFGEPRGGSVSSSESSSSSSVVESNSMASSEDGEVNLASESESSSRESDVTEEGSLTTRLEQGIPGEIVRFALGELETSWLAKETVTRLIEAVERNLGLVEGGGLHPDERTKAHYTLAKHYFGERDELVLQHCRSGLFLLHMRFKLFPVMAAELNMMAAKTLLKMREEHFVKEVVRHVEEARVAMYAYEEQDINLVYQLHEIEAEAFAICADKPECDGLMRAHRAYTAALDMIRMGAVDVKEEWIQVATLDLQVMLRFAKHCKRTNCMGVCRGEAGKQLAAGKVIEKAESLRRQVIRYVEARGGGKAALSVLHEFVARAYLEREERRDLEKAKSALEKALRECTWTEGGGGRYAMLREMVEDVKDRIADLGEEETVEVEESEQSCDEGDFW